MNSITPLAYRINDFCQAMGIGKSAFYILVKAGKIKTIVIAGRRLIPADEAHRLVREGCDLDCKRKIKRKPPE
jgi:hypothetical protein